MAGTSSIPIVLIPGLGDSPGLYEAQLPALWRFGPVMVADHTRDETIAGIAQRILSHAPPRFALAGLSMGGYTALEIMRQAPDRVLQLALLDTSARADTEEASAKRRAEIAAAERGDYAEVVERAWLVVPHESHVGDQALKRRFVDMHLAVGAEVYVRQQHAIMSRPDSRPSLAAIRCPTLVLVGDGDRVTPPLLSQELTAGIAGARLATIPDCGHISSLEQPTAVTAELIRWLQG